MRALREWPWYPKFAVSVSLVGMGAALLEGDSKMALLMALLAMGFVPEDVLTEGESILRELLWGSLGVVLWHVSTGLFSDVFFIIGLAVMLHGIYRLVQKF